MRGVLDNFPDDARSTRVLQADGGDCMRDRFDWLWQQTRPGGPVRGIRTTDARTTGTVRRATES